jgi:hypothetical protein
LTSAGWTSLALFPQELRVNVMTAASSTLESCLNDCIAVFGLPLRTRSICASPGPVAIFEPASAGNAGGAPLPVGWWHATQFAA